MIGSPRMSVEVVDTLALRGVGKVGAYIEGACHDRIVDIIAACLDSR